MIDLLARGLFLDEYSSYFRNKTALQLACGNGDINAVNILLQHGAEINALASEHHILISGGMTALQAAASCGHIPIIVKLLQFGADVNAAAAEKGGRTALEAAAEGGRLDAVQLLMSSNSNLPMLKKDCKRASRLAPKADHTAIGDMLEARTRKLSEGLGL